MAVMWVGGTPFVWANSTTLTAATPAGLQDRDVLLAFVLHSKPTPTPPPGWSLVVTTGRYPSSTYEQYLSAYRKEAVTASDSATGLTWTQSATGALAVIYAAARGAHLAESANRSLSNFYTYSIEPPVLTARQDGELFLTAASAVQQAVSAVTPTPPTGATRYSGEALTQYRLAGAYQTRNAGEANSGSWNLNPSSGGATNSLGAITIRLAPLPQGQIDAPSPLQTPALQGYVGNLDRAGDLRAPSPLQPSALLVAHLRAAWVAAPSPLAAAKITAYHWPLVQAHANAQSPLHPVALRAYHDYSLQVGESVTRYVLDLVTPGGPVRVPISSWQATLQVGMSNYLQAVVPACAPWVDAIGAATEFVVLRQASRAGAVVLEQELARAPMQTPRYDRGPQRFTCTLAGYADGFAVPIEGEPQIQRTLTAVRSVSVTPGARRVRCAVDWLLRPGHRVTAEAEVFDAAYINYYCTGADAYMDVGER